VDVQVVSTEVVVEQVVCVEVTSVLDVVEQLVVTDVVVEHDVEVEVISVTEVVEHDVVTLVKVEQVVEEHTDVSQKVVLDVDE
jgi:hypothetical protein